MTDKRVQRQEPIREALALFHEPGKVFEIRIPKTKMKTVSGYFDDPAKAAEAAAEWDGRCDGIYFTVNPVQPALLARAANRLGGYAEHTTSDADVLSRRWFLIDFDPRRPSGISSTSEQHVAALERAKACIELLRQRGWPEPVVGDSGNGAHLNYRVDEPNDRDTHELLKKALSTLDLLLSDQRVSVDLTPHNAARIWKVYGTKACKGDSTADNPHRRSRILKVPDPVVTVSSELLRALAAEGERFTAAKEEPPAKAGVIARETGRALDLESWIAERGLPVSSHGEWQGGRKWILNPCPWNTDHTNGAAFIVQFPNGAIAAGCHHNGCAGKDWAALRDLYEPQRAGRVSRPPVDTAADAMAVRRVSDTPALTDLGNAQRLVREHGGDLRYCETLKGWYVWDGARFRADETGEIERRVRTTIRAMHAEAHTLPDDKAAQALERWAFRSESLSRITAMINLARSEPGIPALPDEFDSDAWALNTPTGVLDLRSGQLSPHQEPRLLTKVTRVGYVPDAPCPTWETFIHQIMAGREDLVAFVKRVVGYSLTGSLRDHAIFILHGTGSNGKTTLLEVLRHVLGDYALQTPAETFLAKQQNNGISNDVARLRGARFVTASETDEGKRLAEVLVKQVTGGDTVTARFLYGDFFDFKPQFKAFLATNHKPQIRGTDEGIWRRIKLIPFAVCFSEQQKDRELPEKLKAEASGILRWAVEGCLEWQRIGLAEPQDVLVATSDYRQEMDVLAAYIDEQCVVSPALTVSAGDLYSDYQRWCKDNGEYALSQKRLGQRLRERGFEPNRNDRQRLWRGLGLQAAPAAADSYYERDVEVSY